VGEEVQDLRGEAVEALPGERPPELLGTGWDPSDGPHPWQLFLRQLFCEVGFPDEEQHLDVELRLLDGDPQLPPLVGRGDAQAGQHDPHLQPRREQTLSRRGHLGIDPTADRPASVEAEEATVGHVQGLPRQRLDRLVPPELEEDRAPVRARG